jgi:hypothetical protein
VAVAVGGRGAPAVVCDFELDLVRPVADRHVGTAGVGVLERVRQALLDTFILSGPSKRYRSALFGIAVRSAQSVVVLGLVLALVLKG